MKHFLRIFSILFVTSALYFSSCSKDETIVENPPVEDRITEGSEIAILIQRAAIENRSFDDFIDLADCLSINLPLTIIINDISITINDEIDYEEVIALMAKLDNDFELEIVYPIVITLSDYTQIVINSEEELIPYVEACQEMDNDIPCIEFVFPLSFSIYDIEFELIDTIEINSNEELYFFIGNIQAGTLVSINFPVEMVLQNGEIIVVNNNTELQEAIEAAELACNMENQTTFECFEFVIVEQGCDDDGDGIATFVIVVTLDNDANCIEMSPFIHTIHTSSEDAINGVNALPFTSGVPAEYTTQTLFLRTEHVATGDFEIQELQLKVFPCEGETDFSCFDNSENEVTTCVNAYSDNAVFNLEFAYGQCGDPDVFSLTYYTTEQDALAGVNAIPSTYDLASPFSDNTVYVRVNVIANPEDFRIYEIVLFVNNCNDQICTEAQLNQYLNECAWNTNDSPPFVLHFSNGILFADLGENEQTGQYTTSTQIIESTGQEFTQFTITDFTGDFAVLNNTYEVGFCSEELIQVHAIDPNNPISFSAIERDCTAGCENPGFLTEDLIIYIPFGDEAVDLITDEVLMDDAISYTEDRAGNPSCAAAFNGNPISVTMNAINAIINENSFTVSIWFQMANTEAGNLEKFIQKGDNDNEGFTVGVYDLNTPLVYSENPQFSIWDTDWNEQTDVDWMNTDWHHLVITRSLSDDTVQLWRDGILRNSGTGMEVGLQLDGFYYLGENFTGNLDDLRVYKRALNGNEVNQLYTLEADCFTCL